MLGWISCGLIGPDGAARPVRAADRPGAAVKVLDAERRGLVTVAVRGTSGYEIHVTLQNQTGQALRVMMPPGLVAANVDDPVAGPTPVRPPVVSPGPGPIGRPEPSPGPTGGPEPAPGPVGGGSPVYQDMGLGATNNRGGGFGGTGPVASRDGFRSAEPVDPATGAVEVPARGVVDLAIPAICLNFSVPAPPARARLRLVDVDDFSADPRVRRSLRTLATLGTSMGVAQAVMWQVRNGLTTDQMLARNREINPGELALANRFLRALDADAGPPRFDAGHLFVTIAPIPHQTQLVARLARELKGLRILGMPVEVLPRGKEPRGVAPMVHIGLSFVGDDPAKMTARLAIRSGEGLDEIAWSAVVAAEVDGPMALKGLETASLARGIERALIATFVDARAEPKSSTWEIRNRLPFTLSNLTLRVGDGPSSRRVDVAGLGIGPGRTVRMALPAADGVIERVELNGL